MMAGFRQSMAWLHRWCGLLAGWLLFAVFLTGTLCYFRPEISQWMRPELHAAGTAETAAELAAAYLGSVAPQARRWLIELPTEREPAIQTAFWGKPGDSPAFGSAPLAADSGRPSTARATMGADSLYYFHFDLLLPSNWGRLLVGFAAMAMLVAIVSGTIIHRRIFRDVFTFRPGRGQRSWLDLHNLSGVLALPYHLAIAYSGLVTLMFLYMPWGLDAAFPQRQAFHVAAGPASQPPPAAGRAAPLAPLGPMLRRATAIWGGGTAGRIEIFHPGDSNALAVLHRSDAESLAFRGERLRFAAASGRFLGADPPDGGAARTRQLLYGLHIARVAGAELRALLFLSGLAGTAMIGTGLLLWARKRQEAGGKAPDGALSARAGERLVDSLNLALIGGLPIGIAGLFWGNRLLPLDLAERASRELLCLFLLWALAAAHAFLQRGRRAWREQLWAAALLYAALPLLNAATTDRHLGASLAAGDWVFAVFDLAALATGQACAAAALLLGRTAR